MNITSLQSCLSFLKRLASSTTTRPGLSVSSRRLPAGALVDLRVTVIASPSGTSPRTSYSSRRERPIRPLGDLAGSSHGAASMFILNFILTSSEDEVSAGLPLSGVVTTAVPDPELTAMLTWAATSIGLEVNRLHSPKP